MARSLLLALALCAGAAAQAREPVAGAPLVDAKAGRPMVLAFDVEPGYVNHVQIPVQDTDEEDVIALRVRVQPPADPAWMQGHWTPTAFLCLGPAAPSDTPSYCANVSKDASLLAFGSVRLVSEAGEQVFRKVTSRQFDADAAVDIKIVRQGRKVTTTVGGETIDIVELPFAPALWRIGASTGTVRIDMIDEPMVLPGADAWPATMDAAVDAVIDEMTATSRRQVREMPKADLVNFRIGWATDIRDRTGVSRGNDALRIAACGPACTPEDAAMAIMEATWSRLQEQP